MGLDNGAIREICHTIARIGAIDEFILGSNGYYSDVAVLHEPWLAQLGLAINDTNYCRAFSDTLDFQRQHAIGSDGRVKSRWAGRPGDELCGQLRSEGLLRMPVGLADDAQTSWVINVAEQFDFTGDRSWLARQKATCENVLDYLLRRDTDGNGLVKMMTDSHLEAQGSDWIDVVWAAYENALVNAQMYWALSRWAECEELLGDGPQAARYREAAGKLKRRFNLSTTEGGFWDAQHQCYAYWRDKDGSVHGTNLVVPVNFSAIGYGLCDEPGRRTAILDQIENLMRQEDLFFWPLCFFSYAQDEGHAEVNWPFPKYENGDLFLAWGELGTRAYAAQNPPLALKYVKNVLANTRKTGWPFSGIAADPNRAMAMISSPTTAVSSSVCIANLYGVQPKYNRLYLEPHLTRELNGTHLNYGHRGKEYHIDLSVGDYAATVDKFKVRSRKPFGVNVDGHTMEYFNQSNRTAALAITTSSAESLELTIDSWPEAVAEKRSWSESSRNSGVNARHVISNLAPNTVYRMSRNGVSTKSLRSDGSGRVKFDCRLAGSVTQKFELAVGQ